MVCNQVSDKSWLSQKDSEFQAVFPRPLCDRMTSPSLSGSGFRAAQSHNVWNSSSTAQSTDL